MPRRQPYDYKHLAQQLGLTGRATNFELYVKCPFHHDRSPSFSLNIKLGLWQCKASCGQGDFPQLVMRILGVSQREAVSWIQSNGNRVSTDVLSQQINALWKAPQLPSPEKALIWRQLYDMADPHKTCQWFLDRGFNWASIRRWGIRWDSVDQTIILPYLNSKSELVGTVTRNLNSGKPKYVNSPSLPSSENLFGLSLQERGGVIIVVEGPLDCIWLDQLGYPAVALLGAEMSTKQAVLLQRNSFTRVVLALDNDTAGVSGLATAEKALVKAGYLPTQIERIQFPEGKKDVNECDERLVGDVLGTRQIMMLAA